MINKYIDSRHLTKKSRSEWAIVSSYYSSMHLLRLVLLLAVGDFPTMHSHLANFLKRDQSTNANWLKSIIRRTGQLVSYEITRSDIIAWLTGTVDPEKNWDEWLAEKGMILSKFKTCRNKLNYEALIASHRAAPPFVFHGKVTSILSRLHDIAHSISIQNLREAIDVIQKFLEANDVDGRWSSYLAWNHENHDPMIIQSYDGPQEMPRYEGIEFLRLISQHQLDPQSCDSIFIDALITKFELLHSVEDPMLSQDVFRNISLDLFSEKGRAMQNLEHAVQELGRSVGLIPKNGEIQRN